MPNLKNPSSLSHIIEYEGNFSEYKNSCKVLQEKFASQIGRSSFFVRNQETEPVLKVSQKYQI